jgi:hypothetical protein
MRRADIANGESQEAEPDEPASAVPENEDPDAHRTGERQAKKNIENDPPS